MSYQRAQGLKNKGLGSLIVDRIISGEGVGRSIRIAISDKTVAKFTRIKEKFDPLNIAKALGGRLGAYAVGRLTGRSNEDISYFTGRRIKARQVESRMNPLVTKVSEGDRRKLKRGDGLADVMSKIYNLIKANIEEQRLHHEVEHNLNIDKEKQRKKWHKDLINALSGFNVKVGTTAKPEKREGFLDDIIKFITDEIGKLKELFGPVLTFFNDIRKLFGEGLMKSFSMLKNLLENPFIRGLLGEVAIGVAAGYLLAEGFIKLNEKIMQGVQKENERLGGPEAAKITKELQQSDNRNQLAEIPDQEYDSPEYEAKQAKLAAAIASKQKKIEEIVKPYGYVKSGVTRSGEYLFTNAKGAKLPSKALQQAGEMADSGDMSRKLNIPSPLDVKPRPSDALQAQVWDSRYGKTNDPTTGKALTASPVPAEPNSTTKRVQDAIGENNNLNLTNNKPNVIKIDNSKSINTGGSSGPAVTMDGSVPVRTDDPTLQNIQKKNLRMV